MSAPRLGIIGGGAIADFHAPALRQAGFALAAVASRPGSATVGAFAERHGVEYVFDGPRALLQARDAWDALLISVPIDDTLAVLHGALETGAPTLVEKPVALRSADLEPLLGSDAPVIVGYNRRFYATVRAAREEAVGAPLTAQLQLPEAIVPPDRPDPSHRYLENLFANSVHGLDLARSVLGHLEVEAVSRILAPSGNIAGLQALLRTERGDACTLAGNWGAPANYAFSIDRAGRRMELRPFEVATIYEGMEVHEPTPEVPVRRYEPRAAETVNLDAVDARFKPGFVGQAEAFARLCRGEDPHPAARLADAHAMLVLCEQLIGAAIEGDA